MLKVSGYRLFEKSVTVEGHSQEAVETVLEVKQVLHIYNGICGLGKGKL